VARTTQWATITREDFAQAMAEVYSWMNFAHPFREGNGRTAKVVLDHVAALSPFELHYDLIDAASWNRAALLTMPDRGTSTPQPGLAVALFTAIAVNSGGPN
jgi:cell filamentation protein